MDKTSFNIKQMLKNFDTMLGARTSTKLTQADYQMIQVLVAEKITELEDSQSYTNALKNEFWHRADKDDIDGFNFFKLLNRSKMIISKIKARKNKLAHLQYKLKYLAKNY